MTQENRKALRSTFKIKITEHEIPCTVCKGTGLEIWRQLDVCECRNCLGSGNRIDQLTYELERSYNVNKYETERYLYDIKVLKDWIKKNSKCDKCKGDQMKTPGLTHCTECGLEGKGYWG